MSAIVDLFLLANVNDGYNPIRQQIKVLRRVKAKRVNGKATL